MNRFYITLATIVLSLMMVPTMAHAQIQQSQPQSVPPVCQYCPQPQPQPQMLPQPQQYVPQLIQPQAVQAPSGITVQNITDAVKAAVDPINKHLTVIDGQIVNITKQISTIKQPPLPPPLPPPTNNGTAPPPPPPPPNQSCPSGTCPNSQSGGSSCPSGSGGPGPSFGGGYPMFYGGPRFGGFPGFNGGHHGGHHG